VQCALQFKQRYCDLESCWFVSAPDDQFLLEISGNDDNFGLFNELRGMLAAGYVLCVLLGISQIPQLFVFFYEQKHFHIILGSVADLLLLWITTYRIILLTYLINRKRFLFGNINYWWKEIKTPKYTRLEWRRTYGNRGKLPDDVALLFKQLLSKPNGRCYLKSF
jgi:hypothetical protein